jgi:hypothetical protein
MKTNQSLTTAVLLSASVAALLGACCRPPKPTLPKHQPGELAIRAKNSCPTSFAIAELPDSTSCAAFAASFGRGLQPVPIGLLAALRRSDRPKDNKTGALDPLVALARASGGQLDRRIGKKNYCVLALADRKALSEAVASSPIRMAVDCPVVGGSSALSDALMPLVETTRRQTRGAAAGGATPLVPWTASVPSMGTGVKVAILDTLPPDVAAPNPASHGFGVAHAIASVACDPLAGPCQTQLRPYLAMPMVTTGGQPQVNPDGGAFGNLFQLAEAIEQAITENPDGHLVINLSLGWEPELTLPGDPDVDYVQHALRHAACVGAVVIAAAGNLSSFDGPMLPGGWEAINAPRDCSEFNREDLKTDRPLVYAVGGVDAVDGFLGTTRPGGKPRLAAYGLYATMLRGTDFIGPISGTSAAAAFVSGIAASAWAASKTPLAPEELMDKVYAGGTEISNQAADFCLYRPCTDRPRRVSLCGALTQVGASPSCTSVPFAAAPASNMIPPPPPITADAATPGPAGTDAPAFDGERPLVSPQDPTHGCSSCYWARTASGTDTLWGWTASTGLNPVSASVIGYLGTLSQSFPLSTVPPMNSFFTRVVNTRKCYTLFGSTTCINYDENATLQWTFPNYQVLDGLVPSGP